MNENPYHDAGMFKGAKSDTFKKAENLRNRMTDSETKLWELLKNKVVTGYRFRRQHPFGYYILDFYNHQLKLCIEVDGEYHETQEQKQQDIERDNFLKFNGISVIRFKNKEVEENLDNVIESINEFIKANN
jgi:very-short-patch-repair endonuclease